MAKTGVFHDAVTAFKRRLILETLAAHGGNRTRAARALGLNRTYLDHLIRHLGLDVPHGRHGRPRVRAA